MTDNIDHAAQALRGIDPKTWSEAGASDGDLSTLIGVAQVHATLALVAATEKMAEQQRIANLIAYHAAGMHKGAIDGPGLPGPHEQARKGLRL